MLKHRLMTAAILIPLFTGAVTQLTTNALSAGLAVVIAIGAWEWSRLIGLSQPMIRTIYVLMIGALLFCTQLLVNSVPGALMGILGFSVICWLGAWQWIRGYNNVGAEQILGARIQYGLIGIIVLVPSWLAVYVIHGQASMGTYWLLFLMVMIWGADSGAYFAGRRFGKNKLAPNVSPGKTWEGAIGGLCASGLIALIGGYFAGFEVTQLLLFLVLCVVTIALSIIGDLFESMIKRRCGAKDSGTILPGHGGVLDRIDSLTSAAPFFALGMFMLGHFS